MNKSHHTYQWVKSHAWMNHFTCMNVSRHTYEWDVCDMNSHVWMRCVCQTYERDVYDMNSEPSWMQSRTVHVMYMNKLHHAYQSVKSHMSMSHFTRMNVSRHTYAWDRNKMEGACYIHDKSHHTYQWAKSHMSMSHFTRMNVTHHTTGTRWTKSTTAQWVWSDCATNPIQRSFLLFCAYFSKKSLYQRSVS